MSHLDFPTILLKIPVHAAMCKENEACVALGDCPGAKESRMQGQTYELAPIQCGVFSESVNVFLNASSILIVLFFSIKCVVSSIH